MDSWQNFGFSYIFSKKLYSFLKSKKILKKFEKICFEINCWSTIFSLKKSMKFQNFEISFFSIFLLKFRIFESSLTFSTIFFDQNIISNKFRTFQDFFDFEKLYFFRKNILKSEIWSGIQKSYLENYMSIIKLFKIQIRFFWHCFPKSRTVLRTPTLKRETTVHDCRLRRVPIMDTVSLTIP